jgi:hypothetical protein
MHTASHNEYSNTCSVETWTNTVKNNLICYKLKSRNLTDFLRPLRLPFLRVKSNILYFIAWIVKQKDLVELIILGDFLLGFFFLD